MYRLLAVLILINMMSGCSSSEVKPITSPAQILGCQFDLIPSPTYVINPNSQHNIFSYFFYDPARHQNQFESHQYQHLVEQPFKVLKTGVSSYETLAMRKPSLAKARMVNEDYLGKIYQRDRSLSTQVITQNCHIYYASGNKFDKSSLKKNLLKVDDSPLSDRDLLAFLGEEALLEKPFTAKRTFNAKENIWRLDGPSYQGVLLQGIIDAETKQIHNIRLLAKLHFKGLWGDIRSVTDQDGKPLQLNHISMVEHCPLKLTQCILTETVEISLNKPLLETYTEGLEIHFYGAKQKSIEVPTQMIVTFLEDLQQIDLLKASNSPP
ncbi:MAG: hypothetical protein ISEC1_P0499 [Thiomicrorhabdus sp.]|nr:MAG: hypothetical protein ISEC1_P0499 [Thiomicrorhabdus sp.]